MFFKGVYLSTWEVLHYVQELYILSFVHGHSSAVIIFICYFHNRVCQVVHRILYMDACASTYINTYTRMSAWYLYAHACLPIFSYIFFPPWSLFYMVMRLLSYLLILFSIIFQKASYYLPCPICFCVSLK